MTNNEIIKNLKQIRNGCLNNEQYLALDAAIEFLEIDEPKSPISKQIINKSIRVFECPRCYGVVGVTQPFTRTYRCNCGQVIKWDEVI